MPLRNLIVICIVRSDPVVKADAGVQDVDAAKVLAHRGLPQDRLRAADFHQPIDRAKHRDLEKMAVRFDDDLAALGLKMSIPG